MISVIIPTLNERNIEKCVEDIRKKASKDVEIIVADSSQPRLVLENVKVVHSKKGRGVQMNTGARVAKGNILVFLHADTFLPQDFDRKIEEKIKKGYDGGGFLRSFPKQHKFLNRFAYVGDLGARFFKRLWGDSTIFVKTSVFKKIGGYKEVNIMEDVMFCKGLRKFKVAVIKEKVLTSARRFEKRGILKSILILTIVQFLYRLGVKHHILGEIYEN